MAEIAENARVVCDEALERAKWTWQEVDILIPHQPMSWFSTFLADVLRLPDGVVFDTFEVAQYDANQVSLLERFVGTLSQPSWPRQAPTRRRWVQ